MKRDALTSGLLISAIAIMLYLSTLIGFPTELLIPTILIVAGIGLTTYLGLKAEGEESLSQMNVSKTMTYTAVALAGIMLGSLIYRGLFKPPLGAIELSIQDQILYGALYAISEEIFFRGVITMWLFAKLHSGLVAALAAGAIFMFYHIGVYGGSIDNMTYVLIAGTLFSYVTIATQSLASSTIAHILNNLWAVM